MSDVWKRLANVARGTVKTWSEGDRGPDPSLVDQDLDVTPLASAAPPRYEPHQAGDPLQRKREILAMALEDGVITREEYDQRLGDIEAGVGVPDRPKKRTL